MKKFRSLLAVSLMICILSGCSSKTDETKAKETEVEETKTEATEVEETTEETSEETTEASTEQTEQTEETSETSEETESSYVSLDGSVIQIPADDNGLYTYTDGSDEYLICVENNGGTAMISINGVASRPKSICEFDYFNALYLVKLGDSKFLVASPSLMDDGAGIEIFKIEGDEVTSFNSYSGIRIDYSSEFTDPNSFMVSEGHSNGGVIWPMAEFRLTEEGTIVQVSEDWTFTDYSALEYTFKEVVKGKVVVDGKVTDEEKKVPEGETLKAVSTDRESYIRFETEDGTIISCEFYESEESISRTRRCFLYEHTGYIEDAWFGENPFGGGIASYTDYLGNVITFD